MQPSLLTLWSLAGTVTSTRTGSVRSATGTGLRRRAFPPAASRPSAARASSSRLACSRAAISGSGREPLLQRAVPSFDLALGLGMVGPAVLLAHAHQGEQALERSGVGRTEPGRVHGPVVGERGRGDPVHGARLAERFLDRVHGDRRERMRVQEEAGVVVEPGDDQCVRAVGDRPVREVRLPRLVRQHGLEPRVAGFRPLLRLGTDQSGVREDPVDRGVGGRRGALAFQACGDGLRAGVQSPGRQFAADRDDPFREPPVGLVRDPARAAGTRQQACLAVLLVPAFQLVRPLAGDAVAAGGLRHRHARQDRVDDGPVAQELAAGAAVAVGTNRLLL